MGQHDAPISVEQEAWAQARIRKAHRHFLGHVSSRKGYGCIMLMQNRLGDLSMPTLAPTGGEAAKSKQINRVIWKQLKASPLPQVVALTKRIEEKFANALRQQISEDRGENHKDYQRRLKEATKDSPEEIDATTWLESHARDKRKQVGVFTALRLVVSANLPFASNVEGGWVALLAWWKLLRDAAEQAGRSADGWNVDKEEGGWLCRTFYPSNSEDARYKDNKALKWRGLWEFLNALHGWSWRNSAPTYSAIERLTGDTAFQESVSWFSLGYRVDLGS